jgi:hypothetical protein
VELGTVSGTRGYGYAGTILQGAVLSVGSYYILIASLNGASSFISINGTVTSGNAGTAGLSAGISMGRVGGFDYATADILIAGGFKGAFDVGQRIALNRILGERCQISVTE